MALAARGGVDAPGARRRGGALPPELRVERRPAWLRRRVPVDSGRLDGICPAGGAAPRFCRGCPARAGGRDTRTYTASASSERHSAVAAASTPCARRRLFGA